MYVLTLEFMLILTPVGEKYWHQSVNMMHDSSMCDIYNIKILYPCVINKPGRFRLHC